MHFDRMRAIRLTRRGFIMGSLSLAAGLHRARAAGPRRVVSLDYGIATTLLALGVTPAGVTDAEDWDVWVVEPELPESVVDLGDDLAVNLELLAAMKPDLIFSTPYLAAAKPALERIAPVATVTIYAEGGRPLERSGKATYDIARRLDRVEAGESYLAEADRALDACAARIAALRARPRLALVNFMDARHVRIFGRHSLYQDVLERIGIENAWTGATSFWGFQTIPIERLGRVDGEQTRLIAFEPVPPETLPTLRHSPLWNALPFVTAGRVSTLPGVLMFGMVPSALRFAELVTAHLERLGA